VLLHNVLDLEPTFIGEPWSALQSTVPGLQSWGRK